jgi:hypothetical protein
MRDESVNLKMFNVGCEGWKKGKGESVVIRPYFFDFITPKACPE